MLKDLILTIAVIIADLSIAHQWFYLIHHFEAKQSTPWSFEILIVILMAENVPLTSAMDGREIETETEGAQNGYVSKCWMSL